MKLRVAAASLLAAGAMVFGSVAANAADYPSHAVNMYCAWKAGGGSDSVARMIASIMEKELGQPIKVINQTGGGGSIAWSTVKAAKPDGYTIGQLTAELAMNHWANPDTTNVAPGDFDPIALVNMDAAGITIRADAEYKTYDEFVAYVKANPGKVRASGSSAGSIWQVSMGKWLSTIGLPVTALNYIPTTGSAEAMKEMAAGGVDVCFASLAECAGMINSGKAVAIAVMSDERDPKFPDLKTLKELGTDLSIGTWRGFGVPKGTPKDIKDRISAAIKKSVDDPQFVKFMADRGFGIKYLEQDDFGKFMAQSDSDLGSSMKALGLAK
ncbi:MAG: tripartite tricarboxylate transporter substrate binding protein [Succinivibrionaceae bacterium]|nr:tripartite tricarboxylate transporter substrate binding protein [Succinivibrionaceae bacterium]